MKFRMQFVAALALTLCALAGSSLMAAEGKVHEGTVVSAGAGKITLTIKGDDTKHTHDVEKDAMIQLDKKDVKLEELKEGTSAKVTIDDKSVVTMIMAKSK